ncbi:MAG TPA: S8 family serine peptidase, partial [Pyrinomonadaceae bacterium]
MLQVLSPQSLRRAAALALVVALLCPLPASAGIIIRGTQGLTTTPADGIYYDNVSGVTMTGADALLAFQVNGIIFNDSADGVTMTGADGGRAATVDGVSYTGSNSYAATHADGVTMTGADGVTMTGADGVTMTGADGVTMTGADGVTMTGADAIRIDSASQIIATKTDGTIFSAPTSGVTMTGADGVTMTGADGVTMTGADGFRLVDADALSMLAAKTPAGDVGLMSFDPELASTLDALTDDSNVNAAVVYHRPVTDADIAELKALGVRGGTRFRALPVVVVTTSKRRLVEVSKLRSVRYVSKNRTLEWNADDSRSQTGLLRVRQDEDLRRASGVGSFQGNGVTVAVIDTGLDSTHPDLSNRVLRNVKLADLQGANLLDFVAPVNVETLPDTDQLSGHGTFVGGIIAGSGSSSGGKYAGYAPKARLVGLSAGDASLFNVLAGFDYLLAHPELGVRVVNCSFSANTVYDEHDP